MKKYGIVFSVFLLGFCLHGCGCSDNHGQEIEEFCDSLEQYRTVSVSDGNTSFDFDALKEVNPDIYAWLEIPGTSIDYPVLQNADDDLYYLETAPDGSPYIGGSVFTQASYNGTEFEDPVTVLYGNTMRDGTMFGSLQMLYSAPPAEDAAEREILIHLPGEVRYYDVFAAVPFDDTHILYAYDFSSKYWYGNFFERIRNIRSIDAWFDEAYAPEYGDPVILLSTSLADGSDGRFLVMAVFRGTAGGSGEVP